MGFSLETTNYKLGQYAGTDKPNYTTDYNENMAKIDAALKSVSDAGSETNTDLGDTKDRVSALETNVTKNTEDITSVTAAAAQNARDIVSVNSEIEALQTKATEFDGDLETANNNIATANSEIEALQTKNTELDGELETANSKITQLENTLDDIPDFNLGNVSRISIKAATISGTTSITANNIGYIRFTLPQSVDMTRFGGCVLINAYINSITGTSASSIQLLGILPHNSSPGSTTQADLIIANMTSTNMTISTINVTANILIFNG